MEGPRKVSQEEYDAFRSRMEQKKNYDEMSDEEKERFDKAIDGTVVVDDGTGTEDTDDTDNIDDGPDIGQRERERGDDDDEYIR